MTTPKTLTPEDLASIEVYMHRDYPSDPWIVSEEDAEKIRRMFSHIAAQAAEMARLREENARLLSELRNAFADYEGSEGCTCCQGSDHPDHAERIAILLGVPKYDDGSGYDFSLFRTKEATP